jgi:DNA replication protein DnaC
VAFVDDKTGNFTIRPCKCFGSRLTIQRLQSCGVWTRAQRCKLSDFETETATQQILKQTTESFIENPEGRWLCLCGQSGSGKTFLTTAAFVELSFKLGVAGRYLQWNQDSRALKAATLEDPESLWESYKTADLLLLDDVFKGGLPSTADVKMLFEILDFRYNNELTTILSTELTFDQLLEVDQATASRIRQKCGPFLVSISPDVSKNYRLR